MNPKMFNFPWLNTTLGVCANIASLYQVEWAMGNQDGLLL